MRPSYPFFCLIFCVFAAFCFTACEQEINPNVGQVEQKIVVEGYIEASTDTTPAPPPYVILTRSNAFFSRISPATLNDLFIHNAKITLTDGNRTDTLTELCLSNLTAQQKVFVQQTLGIDLTNTNLNVCAYLDLTGIKARQGGTYGLHIVTPEGRLLTATTSIPQHVRLDTLYALHIPDAANDTLVQLQTQLHDPAGVANYYRYSSRRNREPFYAVGYFTDRLFDGRVLPFPLFRASAPNAPSDFTTDGYFWRGDTIAIKWTTIDAASFNFWQTLDATSSGQGPFSSFVRVKTNVTGGLGVWTGASVSYHRLIVPKK